MQRELPLGALGLVLALTGCGGGSAGTAVGSTPAPTPSPSPTPTSVLNPSTSQSFVNDAATSAASYDLTASTTTTASAGKSSLTVAYDAAQKRYALSVLDRQQSFAASDITSSETNLTDYTKQSSGRNDYLALGTNLISVGPDRKYVALGIWQRNQISGTIQDTTFDAFTYGVPTAASAVPRTGVINYSVDAFGVLSTPGFSPKVLHGSGAFVIDLARGIFSLDAPMNSFDLLTLQDLSGGTMYLRAGGYLSSTDGSFSGNLSYDNPDGLVGGTINGRFYGPKGEELGASFAADSAKGGALVGVLSGTDTGPTSSTDLTMDNFTSQKLLNGPTIATGFSLSMNGNTSLGGGGAPGNGQITLSPDGSIAMVNYDSQFGGVNFSPSDRGASNDPNFVHYQRDMTSFLTSGTEHITFDTFKPGSANQQLQLTYLSFGIWNSYNSFDGVAQSERNLRTYQTFGIMTPVGLLSRRTGSAQYDGVIYGTGANSDTNERYEVTGTSHLDIDFSNHGYGGNLTMTGAVVNSNTTRNFGTFSFNGQIDSSGALSDTGLVQSGITFGTITNRFYGPDGEEIGSAFSIGLAVLGYSTDATSLVGISVAKRR